MHRNDTALLVIDLQPDFMPGGALPCAEGDAIVPGIAALLAARRYATVVATQDWHPADHASFASRHAGHSPFETIELHGHPQTLWPDHCVQGTTDAAFHPRLDTAKIAYVQRKGENPTVDSYSAFRDNDHAALTGLADYLKAKGVTALDVCGLATDYCVKFSALDAVDMLPGVKVRFIADASRGIDQAGVENAISEMAAKGIETVESAAITG